MKRIWKNTILLFALVTGVFCTPVICYAEENRTPVYGADVEDGTYQIEVESSSSMFRIVDAQLEVAGDEMTATMTLSGTGYLKLFMGTGEEALEASEEAYIPFVEDAEGAYTYTVPVSALDTEIDCAAYSKRKETWYDRKLVFLSASLPEGVVTVKETESTAEAGEDVGDGSAAGGENQTEALSAAKIADPDLTLVKLNVQDGAYTMEVSLVGGSGKATVASPAKINVSDTAATATIEWSSPNYDYMIVNGQTYLPVQTEGNSTFEIPVLALDQEMDVIGDTTAMSKPHEVEYTLTFHSDTLKPMEEANTKSILPVVGLVLAVALVGFVVWRSKKRV